MARQQSPLYFLERFEVGIVHLDAQRRVTSMNELARRILPVDEFKPFNVGVVGFHPLRSQPKVEFLLAQAAGCPVPNPPPMTMIINIPERVLLIKVSSLSDVQRRPSGYDLVFYDITDLVAGAQPPQGATDQRRQLSKIPTVAGQQVVLVDADDVLQLHSEGHYTRVITATDDRFCNLSLGDLEATLDPQVFMRVHRSHIVKLSAIGGLSRESGRLALRLTGDGPQVPVSRTSAAELLSRLGMSPAAVPRRDDVA